MKVIFVSGHLDLDQVEFDYYYIPRIDIHDDARYVVGDARGADSLFQAYAAHYALDVTVYHMLESPRNNHGSFKTVGGFITDEERDSAMTEASDEDLAWVREGREASGTAKNLSRRKEISSR